jgi:hypothetical protein
VDQKSQSEQTLQKLQMRPAYGAQHHRVDAPAFYSFPMCSSFLGDVSDALGRRGFVTHDNVPAAIQHWAASTTEYV